MKLDSLKVFHTVVKSGKLSIAADKLFITQSAVSQSISGLEEYLGITLFYRKPKGFVLSHEGELLFGYIDKGLREIEKGLLLVDDLKNIDKGEITIGTSDSVCTHYLLDKLDEFKQIHPNINIHIYNKTSSQVIGLLREGKIDFGFINMPIKLSSDIVNEHVMELHDCFIASHSMAFDFSKRYELSEVLKNPIIALEKGTNMRNYLELIGRKYELEIIPSYEVGSSDLLIRFAEKNFGIAFVTKEFTKKELDEGSVVEIDLYEVIDERYIDIVILKERKLSHAAHAFYEMVRS